MLEIIKTDRSLIQIVNITYKGPIFMKAIFKVSNSLVDYVIIHV